MKAKAADDAARFRAWVNRTYSETLDTKRS